MSSFSFSSSRSDPTIFPANFQKSLPDCTYKYCTYAILAELALYWRFGPSYRTYNRHFRVTLTPWASQRAQKIKYETFQ